MIAVPDNASTFPWLPIFHRWFLLYLHSSLPVHKWRSLFLLNEMLRQPFVKNKCLPFLKLLPGDMKNTSRNFHECIPEFHPLSSLLYRKMHAEVLPLLYLIRMADPGFPCNVHSGSALSLRILSDSYTGSDYLWHTLSEDFPLQILFFFLFDTMHSPVRSTEGLRIIPDLFLQADQKNHLFFPDHTTYKSDQ